MRQLPASQLLTEPAREYNNQVYIERAAHGLNQDLTAALQNNVDDLSQLVSAAQAEGILVLLFELPYPTRLDQAQLVQDTRRVALGRFDNSKYWLHLTLAKRDLRRPDRMHMDERSAIQAARAIERALNDHATGHDQIKGSPIYRK